MTIRQIPQPIWKGPVWTCICDKCGKAAEKNGSDPGEASEFARKEGFTTQVLDLADPLLWVCRSCREAPPAKSSLNGSSKLNSVSLRKDN